MNQRVETEVVEVASRYAETVQAARANIARSEERRRHVGRTTPQAPPSMESRLKPNEVYDSALRGMALAELRRNHVAIVRDGSQFKVDPSAIALFVDTFAQKSPGLVIVPDQSVTQTAAEREQFRTKVRKSVTRTRQNLERVAGLYDRISNADERTRRRLQIEADIEQYRLTRDPQPPAIERSADPVVLAVTGQMSFLQTLGVFEEARQSAAPRIVSEIALREDSPRIERALDAVETQQIAMGF